jgi:hypothetical protein
MMEGLYCQTGLPCGLCLNTIARTGCFYLLPSASTQSRLAVSADRTRCPLALRTLVPPRLWMHRRLVAQRSMLGDWIQSSRSGHAFDGHSRYPHGISTPTACLPAFALPTATTTSGMPCPATACEPRSICAVPCTPSSSLCTCKLACQTAANDVAATAPSGSPCLLPALVHFALLLRTCVCLTLTVLRSARGTTVVPLALLFLLHTEQFFCIARASGWFFHTPKWAFWSSDPQRPPAAPPKPRQLLGPHQNGRSIGTVFVL